MTDPNSPIIDFYPVDFEVDMNGKRFAWQGIAKLPFIDEARLLAEVEKLEHTLTEEEIRRNSVMFEMLFVTSSHPLSVCIYSLDNRCKQLTDKERVEVKERIDPKYSEGMNGYISPCTGEPCPPVFRSPVESMEDIMDNQVICAIYRLPDGHKHITRPPAGVIFPKKIVSVGDLKPAPVLWHEESGRKPFENARRPFENARRPPFENARRPFDNARQNPPGSISGRHLEEAAHRLIVNSLQAKVDSNGYGNQMHALRPSYVGPRNYPPHHSYTNNGSYAQGHSRMPPPRTIHHPQAQHRASNVNAIPRHGDPGYNDQHSSSAAHHHQNSSHTQHYERSSGPGYHQSGNHQSGGPIYPQRPIPQAPPGVTPVPYQGGYNNYQNYQPSGPPAQGFDGWVPQVSQNPGRGYGRPQQSGNQYSGLDRRGHRRPPPTQPGYGHK